jgi:membrane protease YdiL (CAAX protease family)
MKPLTIYRIFSYILIIIALFLGLAVVLALFLALANPALLLNVFVAAAVVMYSISSFLFLINGIDGKKNQKLGIKDFIRVNAFVAIVFAVMNIFQASTVIMNPSVLNEAIAKMPNLTTANQTIPIGLILKVMKAIMWFLLLYSIVLLVHIQLSFRYLKQFVHLFSTGIKE